MGEVFASPKDVAQEHRARGLPENFCLVPFTTLILEPDGQVGSCRHKGSEFPVGDIRTQSLEEIWNGPKIRQWRREFLAGKPGFCATEVKHRACHLCPNYNSLLPHIQAEEFQTSTPIRLGINFNGKCNLQCKMCHIWQKPNGLYDEIGFWEKLEKYVPGLKEVELLSGEPFIQSDTYRLIDLLSAKNPECLWTVTTNAHWKLTDKIKNSLDRIRFKNLIVSVDSLVPETYAKIRRGGDLRVVLSNLDRLLEYDRSRIARGLGSLGIRVNFLVQRDNWSELAGFDRFALEKDVEIFRTFCYEPSDCTILTLSEADRENILDHYLATLAPQQLFNCMRVILPILESLPPLSRCHYLEELSTRRPSACTSRKSPDIQGTL